MTESGDAPAGSPRARILEAAGRLFGEQGVRNVGVNAVIAEADVAKATFYRHFPSKTDLVVAWLRSPSARWIDEVREDSTAGQPPTERLRAFFDVIGRWLGTDGHRGCPYLSTATEWRDRPAAVQEVIVEYFAEVESYLMDLVAELGTGPPAVIARRLRLLTAGAMSLAVAQRGANEVDAARDAADALIK